MQAVFDQVCESENCDKQFNKSRYVNLQALWAIMLCVKASFFFILHLIACVCIDRQKLFRTFISNDCPCEIDKIPYMICIKLIKNSEIFTIYFQTIQFIYTTTI